MKNIKWSQQLTRWLIVIVATALVSCWPSGSDAVNPPPETVMDKVQVTISIGNAHMDQLEQISEQLTTAGLEVEQTLSTLGVITGSVETEKMSALSEVSGVESVELNRTIQLAPPDANVQ